jgi:hypothetical protein
LAVRLVGKLEDGTVFTKKGHGEGEPFEFKTDEEQVIDGLDKTVITMKKGEVALARIPPELAFGSTETKGELAVVPPNSTVFYEVELVSFEKVIVVVIYFLVYLSISASPIDQVFICVLLFFSGERILGFEEQP